MLKKVINPILYLPLALFANTLEALPNEKQNVIDKVLEEKSNKLFISYEEIDKIVLNNPDLKSLQNSVNSASFNLSSKIAKRYPSLDFQANGLPKYISGKNYSSSSQTLKTSQLTANPRSTLSGFNRSPEDLKLKLQRKISKLLKIIMRLRKKILFKKL